MQRTRPRRTWLRRSWLRWPGSRRRVRAALLGTALAAAGRGWPVVPGAYPVAGPTGPCSCEDPNCPVPGAHPHDPPLLAATTDARMVSWWWERRSPDSPVLVATGRTVCAVSLPAGAGARALEYFAVLGVRLGPVLASPGRYVLLVAPYSLEELGELLAEQPWVPGSLRYHGPDGYLMLPPSRTGAGAVRWVRPPVGEEPWLPQVGGLLDALIAASTAAPDDRRLAF
ncbi:bifunctional DNA primase/polymerase [Kitasatospora atroaurantiaca]|uniref:Bifunctional DNA primase/polymerase-like protein n=1 Tax=Kitasatospora atroaurantiaca TaxID=285545 RepID=A0A561ES63_9ACTN|nr:bifunctional DNA primase/polymerase [Kitasatospora atroaurantiaca]TWE18447.1 bifunctional DNA primase/polymerase-like protein [Kitasatospora atroaurantiaca]